MYVESCERSLWSNVTGCCNGHNPGVVFSTFCAEISVSQKGVIFDLVAQLLDFALAEPVPKSISSLKSIHLCMVSESSESSQPAN